MYKQALTELDQQHYKNALTILQDLDRIAPGNLYVQQKMSFAQSEVSAGHDQTTTSLQNQTTPSLQNGTGR
jgi:outer membrane protein assembly factor BamD (BamD/ComL family)